MTDEIPPPPEDWEASKPWLFDTLAEQEQALFPDEQALKNTWLQGKIRAAKHAGYIVTFALWLVFLAFTASLASWLLHYIGPSSWHWLTEPQLSKVQAVIFSGSVGALVTGLIQRFTSGAPK